VSEKQHKDSTKQIIIIGFIVNIFLTGSVIGVGLYYLHTIHRSLNKIVNVHNVKLDAVSKMGFSIVQRGYQLAQMLLLDDEEQQDSAFMIYHSYAGIYAQARLHLLTMQMNTQEQRIFARLEKNIRKAKHINDQVAEFLIWDDDKEKARIAIASTIEVRRTVLNDLAKLADLQHAAINTATQKVEQQYANARLQMFLWALILWSLSGIVGFMTMRNAVTRNKTLVKTYGELEVTLQQLTTAKQRVEQSNQDLKLANQAKSQFLATMSHELRTPLNAIIGFSELIEGEAADEGYDNIQEDAQYVQTAGHHLLSLIDDLLNISKIEAGKMELYTESFDLKIFLHDVSMMMYPIVLKKHNELYEQYDPNLSDIHTDRTKLKQVLYNLLSNANKFTEQGQLYLEVSLCQHQGQTSHHFIVRDTGIGMTAAQQQKLFTAFSQADASTSRKYGGTGLGLVISKRFIEMMGGQISLSSEINVGSVFEFYLPLSTLKQADNE